MTGAFALGCLISSAGAEPLTVKDVKGPAQVRRAEAPANRWEALKKGAAVSPGDAVRTGKKSQVELKEESGTRLVIGPWSHVKVEATGESSLFELTLGRLKAFVKKLKPANKFEVRTPLAAAAVRGTSFEMGYDPKADAGFLDVDEGVVALSMDGREVDVRAGQRMDFVKDLPLGEPAGRGAERARDDQEVRAELRHEVGLGMSKEMVMAAAAQEIRTAEYMEGKTLVDVNGTRVRLEEYIIRRPQDAFVLPGEADKAFKFVVLNERDSRFDYFYYLGVFDQVLDDDLSKDLNTVRGTLNEAPDNFLVKYEMGQSNTQDYIKDRASGGHLVDVYFDGENYILTDHNDPNETRTIAADEVLSSDLGVFHKIYDPVGDRFITITDAQYQAGGGAAAVYDAAGDTFRAIVSGDIYYRTAFNNYTHAVSDTNLVLHPTGENVLQSYAPSGATILALDLDADFTYAGGSVLPVVETPSGSDLLHNRITLFYGDGSKETINTYIISDEGDIGPMSAFAGLTTGPEFKSELLKWNYQQTTEYSGWQGRKIDLVVEPKILIKSGLLQ